MIYEKGILVLVRLDPSSCKSAPRDTREEGTSSTYIHAYLCIILSFIQSIIVFATFFEKTMKNDFSFPFEIDQDTLVIAHSR